MDEGCLLYTSHFADNKNKAQNPTDRLCRNRCNSSSGTSKSQHYNTCLLYTSEVTSHYDIGNDFYKLWLDETMSYSCGYFIHDDDSLYQAQVNKVDYILKKLHLEEGMSLLDIGCGWGFLLIEAAKKYKVHGTGITLSHEQYTEFQKRIKDQGLEDYLTVELMDYRDLPKHNYQFDRVVSVGTVSYTHLTSSGLNVADRLSPPLSMKRSSISGKRSIISSTASRFMEASSRMAV